MSEVVIAVIGAAIVVMALSDLFVTIFNYDGFSFLANRMHGVLWRTMRAFTQPLKGATRHTALSLGSAGMLPATFLFWLALEIAGFALLSRPACRTMPSRSTTPGGASAVRCS